jgi:hypothetical protein
MMATKVTVSVALDVPNHNKDMAAEQAIAAIPEARESFMNWRKGYTRGSSTTLTDLRLIPKQSCTGAVTAKASVKVPSSAKLPNRAKRISSASWPAAYDEFPTTADKP